MRCLRWQRGKLIDLLESQPTLNRSMQASITADLMRYGNVWGYIWMLKHPHIFKLFRLSSQIVIFLE